MFEHPRKAYVLMGVEPEFDCANPQLAVGALKQASLVVFMSAFKHTSAAGLRGCDAAGFSFHRNIRFRQYRRPCSKFQWRVFARWGCPSCLEGFACAGVILNLEGLNILPAKSTVRDEVLGRSRVCCRSEQRSQSVKTSVPEHQSSKVQRIADVPINFADPMARRSPSLQQTADSCRTDGTYCEETLAGLASRRRSGTHQGEGEETG